MAQSPISYYTISLFPSLSHWKQACFKSTCQQTRNTCTRYLVKNGLQGNYLPHITLAYSQICDAFTGKKFNLKKRLCEVSTHITLGSGIVFISGIKTCPKVCAVLCLGIQSCPTLCNPMDYSQPDTSVHGDSPGKNTGVVCHTFSRGPRQPRDQTQVSSIAGEFFTS